MSAILPSNYFGSSVAAIQVDNGDTRIYYQSTDGAIYHTGGVGSAASGAKYRVGVVLVPGEDVRSNSPIAVVTWGGNFSETRLYFIDPTNRVRELWYSQSQHVNFVPGGLDAMDFRAAPNSGLLYAITNSSGHVRVGFQSADAPEVITEAEYTGGKWVSAKLSWS